MAPVGLPLIEPVNRQNHFSEGRRSSILGGPNPGSLPIERQLLLKPVPSIRGRNVSRFKPGKVADIIYWKTANVAGHSGSPRLIWSSTLKWAFRQAEETYHALKPGNPKTAKLFTIMPTARVERQYIHELRQCLPPPPTSLTTYCSTRREWPCVK